MTEEDRQRGNPIGGATQLVAANVRTVRNFRKWTLERLAGVLSDQGWPLGVAALSKLEGGKRRIDVDDLVAISSALGVDPTQLMSNERDYVLGMPEHIDWDALAAEHERRYARAIEFRERVRMLLADLGG